MIWLTSGQISGVGPSPSSKTRQALCRWPGNLPVVYFVIQVGNWGTGNDDVGLIQSTKAPKSTDLTHTPTQFLTLNLVGYSWLELSPLRDTMSLRTADLGLVCASEHGNQLVYLHPTQQSQPLSPLHEPLHGRAKRDPKA